MSLTILFCAKRLYNCRESADSEEFQLYLQDLQLVLGTKEINQLFFKHLNWETMPPFHRRNCLINYIQTELKADSLYN